MLNDLWHQLCLGYSTQDFLCFHPLITTAVKIQLRYSLVSVKEDRVDFVPPQGTILVVTTERRYHRDLADGGLLSILQCIG
jgi:hypothetical protein